MQLTKEDMANASEAILAHVESLRSQQSLMEFTDSLSPNVQVWYEEHTAYLTTLAQAIKAIDPRGLDRKYDHLLERYKEQERRVTALTAQAKSLEQRANNLEQQVNPKEQI